MNVFLSKLIVGHDFKVLRKFGQKETKGHLFHYSLYEYFSPMYLVIVSPDASGSGQPISGDRPALLGSSSQGNITEHPSCKFSQNHQSLSLPLLHSPPLVLSPAGLEAPVFLVLEETRLFRCSPFENWSQRMLSDELNNVVVTCVISIYMYAVDVVLGADMLLETQLCM